MEKIKKFKKIAMIITVFLMAVIAIDFGYIKFKDSERKLLEKSLEMQNKIEEQRDKITEQQSKIEELQGFKSEQQQAKEEANQQDKQTKKVDCEVRIKKQQESLADAQRMLGEYQVVVKYVQDNNCPKEKTRLCDTVCYDDCLKNSYDCSGSSCGDEAKKDCKKRHEENLKNIKGEMSDEADSVKEQENKLQGIKNECKDYI